MDTSQTEAAHKFLVKQNFARTNKRGNFQEQIIRHAVHRINAEAMQEVLLWQDETDSTMH